MNYLSISFLWPVSVFQQAFSIPYFTPYVWKMKYFYSEMLPQSFMGAVVGSRIYWLSSLSQNLWLCLICQNVLLPDWPNPLTSPPHRMGYGERSGKVGLGTPHSTTGCDNSTSRYKEIPANALVFSSEFSGQGEMWKYTLQLQLTSAWGQNVEACGDVSSQPLGDQSDNSLAASLQTRD